MSFPTLSDYYAAQSRQIVQVFNDQTGFIDNTAVYFESFERLTQQYSLTRNGSPAPSAPSLGRIGGRLLRSVASVTNPYWGHEELWARGSYRGYRPAFVEWVQPQVAATVDKTLDGGRFDVDHLFARSRAREAQSVVRLVLCPQSSNRGWGAWIEKLDGVRCTRFRHDARYFQLAKVLGIPAPPTKDGVPSGSSVQSIVDALTAWGVDPLGGDTAVEISGSFRDIASGGPTVVSIGAT
jgi:hypothetical protein